MAKGIDFDGGLTCAIGVKDLDESLTWYREKLGWEVAYKVDEIGWAEINTSVPNVMIGMSPVEQVEVKGGPTLTFGVKDVEAAKANLEAKGVQFDGDIVEYPGMVRLATFFDVNGHKYMFYQSLAEG